MKGLIDADMPVYSCGFSAQHNIHDVYYDPKAMGMLRKSFDNKKDCNKFTKELDENNVYYDLITTVDVEPVENALHNTKVLIERILEATRVDSYQLYLTGKDNFRVVLFPEYKAGRPPKPVHYQAIRDYLVNVWGAIVVDGQEADDAMSIAQYADPENTIICSRDKDLDMVPGNHYNWEKDIIYTVDKLTGLRSFYGQMLKGDSTDNIPGIYKTTGSRCKSEWIGFLDNIDDEWEMWDFVLSLYGDTHRERVVLIARLLWMQEYDGQIWTPPEESGEEEHGQISSPGTDGE